MTSSANSIPASSAYRDAPHSGSPADQPPFVATHSIVRSIWGRADTVLFIFAGAAAEFALNKAVDWLYFTGKLPADPLGRLFSTVSYARGIIFSPAAAAYKTIDAIRGIHTAVESARGAGIPDWAYRDVLYLLIHYSVASYELLQRRLRPHEKEEVYQVFYQMGSRMGLKELPLTYTDWLPQREAHLAADLQHSRYTGDLFRSYRKHLGALRFRILVEVQKMLVPGLVRKLLRFPAFSPLRPALSLYKIARRLRLDGLIKSLLLPRQYKAQLGELDVVGRRVG